MTSACRTSYVRLYNARRIKSSLLDKSLLACMMRACVRESLQTWTCVVHLVVDAIDDDGDGNNVVVVVFVVVF